MAQETIAIAGAGRKTGSVFTRCLAGLNQYRLLLLPETGDPLKDPQEPGFPAEQVNGVKDGCWEADIIVLDLPFSLFTEVAEKIREVSTQKIVFILSVREQEAPASRNPGGPWQDLLPNAKLVLALNELNPAGTVLTGSDAGSLSIISEILKKMGFQPIIKEQI